MRFGSRSQETRHSRPKRGSFSGTSSPAPLAAPQSAWGTLSGLGSRGVRATWSPSPRGNILGGSLLSVFFFFRFEFVLVLKHS